MMIWFVAFIWTLVIELPVYELGAKCPPFPWWHMPVTTLGLNLLTHPAFSWWSMNAHPSFATVLVMEVLISFIEGLVLLAVRRDLGTLKPLVLAFSGNAASYGLGLLLVYL